jgi:hypothetical protein
MGSSEGFLSRVVRATENGRGYTRCHHDHIARLLEFVTVIRLALEGKGAVIVFHDLGGREARVDVDALLFDLLSQEATALVWVQQIAGKGALADIWSQTAHGEHLLAGRDWQ